MKVCELVREHGLKVDVEDYNKLTDYSWYIASTGYVACKNRKVSLLMHRFILNYEGDLIVDHINHDKLDNRKTNLRLCTQVQNQNNRETITQANNTSGVNGVSFCQYGWHAYVWVNRKRIHLGYYVSIALATEARRLYDEGLIDVLKGKLYERGTTPMFSKQVIPSI